MATRRKAPKSGNRAVLYVRVSTVQQATEGLSLEAQQERLMAYCTLRGLDVVDVVVERGESAGKPLSARPGGRKVLALLKAKRVDAVVVLKLDRAFRNTVDALQTVEAWDKAGVAFHVADMGGTSIDTSGAMGKMVLTMLAGFAEFERNLTAERTTAALAHKARCGDMRLGKDAPFGWKYAGNALAEVEAEQLVIARAKVLRATGLSLARVCSELTALGHHNRAGREFVPMQIDRMLRGSVRQMHAAHG
jgi:site-specific DNA recombinase